MLVKISYSGEFYSYRSKDWEEFSLDVSSDSFKININPPIVAYDDYMYELKVFAVRLEDIDFKNVEDLKYIFKLIDIKNII